ncbi:hypothetical protein PLEOSDRAFT_1113443 [Pleurotus ostreatus PC15]|uniref:Anaphase-promoting complex subunit 2 n=1 Tax=Pleurotus ostreatus (strain PC15) TaxID=1137138 RepID=A0A067NEQ7_PLEO1|nr:hypothetical protein PLEOSDRAFT_1113443 [Pleurotus ostreatus PC15]
MARNGLRYQVATKWQDSFRRFNQREPGISGLIAFSQAWDIATEFLKPRNINEPLPSRQYTQAVRAALDVIHKSKRLPTLIETFLSQVESLFYLIQQEVDQFMIEYTADLDVGIISKMVYRVHEWMKEWTPATELGAAFQSVYINFFQTHLFSILPESFSSAFKDLIASTLAPEEEGEALKQDHQIWSTFDALGFIDRFESLIASVGYEHIERHVLETCTGQWGEPMLTPTRDWMTAKIVPWMIHVYGRNITSTEEARAMLAGVGSRFDFHMAKTLCDLRTREIFDIIIDFPDSEGALKDLKECLQRVDQRAALVQSLRQAHRKRLLHPGADTKLILSQYVATIKCLRIVDPPGVLLFKVADPIRRYLRDRPDTIRSIVANLVGDDDSGDALVDETEPPRPLQAAEIEDYSDPNWEPEPIDAGPDFRANKPSDIISTLVSIYDSKDFFVKELQILLAQRLLAAGDDQSDKVEKERRNIEILKIRFGEAALQVCEVMLKDMTDSKRIDQHIQSQQASVIHPAIISKHFWPALESSEILMPGQLKELQDQYTAEFTKFKPDKRLRWLTHLGTVDVELEFEDRVVEALVSPLEAAVIELFSEQSEWTLDDIAKRVGLSQPNILSKAVNTWLDLGVLASAGEGIYRVLEVSAGKGAEAKDHVHRPTTVEVEMPPVVSVQQQQAEQMRVYWKFIEGMLTNLGALPLDRIQTMLKFAPGYDRTITQLAGFMEAARREDLVTVRDGMWKLNK